MKLIYLWIKKHYSIENKGFTFSANHKVNFDYNESNKKANISIERKDAYNFYGDKITEMTAIVGENGSGKTTLAYQIMSICQGINLIEKNDDKEKSNKLNENRSEYVVLYEVGENEYVCYYWLDDFEISSEDNVRFVNTDMAKIKGEKFKDEQSVYNLTCIYFSNTFDMKPINGYDGLSTLSGEFDKATERTSTIASKIFSSISYRKTSYGSNVKGKNLVVPAIEQYTNIMVTDVKKCYLNSIAQDFITVYNKANKVALELLGVDIFKRFKFTLQSFGRSFDIIDHYTPFYEMDSEKLKMLFVKTLMNEQIIEANKSNNLKKIIYTNTLCEIILFTDMYGHKDFNEFINETLKQDISIIKSKLGFSKFTHEMSLKVFEQLKVEAIKNNCEQLKYFIFVEEILQSNNINKNLISNYIDEIASDNIKKSNWFYALMHYLTIFDEIPSLQGDRFYFYFDVKSDFGKLYYKEMQNKYSLIVRNMNFEYIPVSTGELALINLLVSIYQVILPTEIDDSKLENKDNVLFIIDELDSYLHPRWQQLILKKIIDYINSEPQFKGKFQIIVTSHSPIILSDFTSDRVIRLTKDNYVQNCQRKTFGANISKLYYDNFFMDKGSIGEISKNIVEEIIKYINSEASIFTNDDEVEYVINEIGEEFVKRKLLFLFYKNKKPNKLLEQVASEIGIEKSIDILKDIEVGENDD